MKNCLFLFVWVYCFQSYSQINNKEFYFTTTKNNFKDTLLLDGFLDGKNTFSSKKKDIFLYNDNYVRSFEPMTSLLIRNTGRNVIKNPRLFINRNGPWISSEYFKNLFSEASSKEVALAIWDYVNKNRIHFVPPEAGEEVNSDFKMLRSYGYGYCDDAASIIGDIGNSLGFSSSIYGLSGHVVPEINFADGKKYILDSDMEVFYLNLDNSTLASKMDIENDRYLIERTKHFGRSTAYDKRLDKWISHMYDNVNDYKSDNNYSKTNYAFNLRPNECLEFSWDKATKSHHVYWPDGQNTIPEFIYQYVIANGNLKFTLNFSDSTIMSNYFYETNNLTYEKNDLFQNLLLKNPNTPGYAIIRIQSPFVIVDGQIFIKYSSESKNIRVLYSRDLINWRNVNSLNQIGLHADTFNLDSSINSNYGNATYNYFIKLEFLPSHGKSTIGIDSLTMKTIFEVNRFVLPTLELDTNYIEYFDDNVEREISVEIKYSENFNNKPPGIISKPVYPQDGVVINSSNITFMWDTPLDENSDSIEDYEILVSDRPDCKYPISPNFNLYISSLTDTVKPQFSVREPGWFNSDTDYFWKVRAKDSKGAWNNWSPIWKFTPNCTMRPMVGKINIINDCVNLHWTANTKGRKPEFYKIYGSNEANGFTPSVQNLISVVDTTFFNFNVQTSNLYSYYRITSCDKNGQESAPSDVVSLLPFHFSSRDTLSPYEKVKIPLIFNSSFFPYWNGEKDIIYYKTFISIVQKPEWVIEYADSLVGIPDSSDLLKIFFDPSKGVLLARIFDERNIGWEYKYEYFSSVQGNHIPEIKISNHFAVEDTIYESVIIASDVDKIYGDTLRCSSLSIPKWISFRHSGDSIFLSGTPRKGDLIDNCIIVSFVDIHQKVKVDTFKIDIKHTNHSPFFISKPLELVAYGDEYRYNIEYSDPDLDLFNDRLFLKPIKLPRWLNYDSTNLVLHGIVNSVALKDSIVELKLMDSYGQWTVQKFSIHIKVVYPNSPAFNVLSPIVDFDKEYKFSLLTSNDSNLINRITVEPLQLPKWLNFDYQKMEFYGKPTILNSGDDIIKIKVIGRNGYEIIEYKIPFPNIIVENKFIIYPNPFKDFINILIYDSNKKGSMIKFVVFNERGIKIEEFEDNLLSSGNSFIRRDLSFLKKGVFFLEIINESVVGNKIIKLIKM